MNAGLERDTALKATELIQHNERNTQKKETKYKWQEQGHNNKQQQ